LEELREQGKKISAYLYMLPGGAECCGGLALKCTQEQFPETRYFHCRNLEIKDCQLGGYTEEDWGNGLVCALKEGQNDWWNDLSVKVGIILSDELPGGSEGCKPISNINSFQYNSLSNAIMKTKENDIKVFPIKASTCGIVCYRDPNYGELYACLTANCPGGMSTDCPDIPSGSECVTHQCACSPTLDDYMDKIATDTKGKKIALKDSSELVERIKDIMESIKPPELPQIEAGSKSGYQQRVSQIKSGEKPFMNSFDIVIPVSLTGEHTEAHVYRWT